MQLCNSQSAFLNKQEHFRKTAILKSFTWTLKVTATMSDQHNTHFQAAKRTLLYQPQLERGFKQHAGYTR